MKDKVVLYNEEVFDSITQVLIFFFSIPFFLYFEKISFGNELLNSIVPYALFAFILSTIKVSRKVVLKEDRIIKGYYFMFFGLVKAIDTIQVSEIEEFVLIQNEELYFEITAKTDSKYFIINKFPNRNPAEAQLKLVKELIAIKNKTN